VALADPFYTNEFVDSAQIVIERYLAPLVLRLDEVNVHELGRVFAGIVGHRMAKAAVETAVIDAYLRAEGISLGAFLGATREKVACGVSVGIAQSVPVLMEEVRGYIEEGYRRIKLKIRPNWDLEPVRSVREEFGSDLLLSVDANTAYDETTTNRLLLLEQFNLLMIEQPYPEDDLEQHMRLASMTTTPICLDESITSAQVALNAIERGACSIVNIKPGRVGGYLESRRIHDVCQERSIPVWCGGMLETGVGRAANIALAGLPGFSLPNDTSASARYFHEDLTAPFVLEDGYLRVPQGPGIGVDVIPEVLRERERSRLTITRSSIT
jgi:O-succinylbenzoate synthase